MTPENFDPAHSDEEVRRLLAAAAGPVNMPPDVTTRLDDVLTGLVAERTTSDDGAAGAVIDLADRRTSRWPKVLVAAAAVSVLGVGLGNVLNGSGSSMNGDSATSGDAGAGRGAEVAPQQPDGLTDAAPPQDADREPRVATDEHGGAMEERGNLAAGRPPRLRSSSVTVDAQRIADFSLPLVFSRTKALMDLVKTGCRLPSTSKGDEQIAVRLDGERATLVFRAEEDGRRLTEVFSCDDAESPVLITTVDAP